MNVTIKDVARECNVSPSTVSRVIAGSPRISAETKEKVQEAIKKLNYHPNIIARSLANKATKVMGLVLPSGEENLLENPFFIQVMTGISSYAKKSGYYIMYTFCKTEEEELKTIKDYVNSNLVDGIILSVVRTEDKSVKYLQEREFPFVVIGRPEDTKNILWVDNDNFQAMYNVVNKLVLSGHREIAFIGAGRKLNVTSDRLSGYMQAHKIHGLDINKDIIVELEDFKESLAYDAMNEMLKNNKISAVVTTDDLLAMGANNCLKDNHITDVAIVGFNNIPLAGYQKPSLTSVEKKKKKIGQYAAKLLVDKLQDDVKLGHYIVNVDLVERESTKF